MSDNSDVTCMPVTTTGVSTRKDHRFLVDLYRQIEERFDVNAMCLEGVNIWPLVRLQLGRSFKEADQIDDAGMESASTSALPSPNVDLQKIASPQNKTERSVLIKRHAKYAKSNQKESRIRVERDFIKLEEAKGPKFVVQTKIEKYFLKKADRLYAPILDPVAEDLGHFGKVQTLALEPLPFACVNDPLRIDLQAYLAVRTWKPVEISEEINKALKEIEEFTKQAWPEYPLNRNLVYSRFNRLRQRRDYFYEVYRRLQPEFIVVSSFTGWLHALWAAKDLSIPVIDVQHGGQGPIHISTTHFTKPPEEGYHFLPDVLWLWGQTNYDFAAKWHPATGCHRHLPVIGGHRGVARWDNDRKAGKLSVVDALFIEKFHGARNVLVTLSYAIDPLMPDTIFKAIQATKDLYWLIRLHPIHRSDAARDQIAARLTEMGCENYSIDEPTDVQMQTALYVSQAHLTPFSTSVREAVAFGVPSAICHPAGKLLFFEEIETGLLEYSEDTQSIIDFVRRSLASTEITSGLRRDAIETADAALDDILTAAKEVKEQASPLRSNLPVPDELPTLEHEIKLQSRSSHSLGSLFNAIKKKVLRS